MDNKKDTLTIPNLEIIPDDEYEFAKRIVDIIQRFNLLPDKIIPPDTNLLNIINSKENSEVGITKDGKVPYDALSYINWNAGIGTIGYGIRASGASPSAVIQYKHQGGSWANIGSGSGIPTLTEDYTYRGNSSNQPVEDGTLLNDGLSIKIPKDHPLDGTANVIGIGLLVEGTSDPTVTGHPDGEVWLWYEA